MIDYRSAIEALHEHATFAFVADAMWLSVLVVNADDVPETQQRSYRRFLLKRRFRRVRAFTTASGASAVRALKTTLAIASTASRTICIFALRHVRSP